MSRIQVLAIDDEPVILDLIARLLPAERYAVTTAQRSDEGLRLFEQQDYQVVIADLKMPGPDGLEVVRTIKQRRPSCVTIMLTGYATLEVALELMHQGCDDLLLKPLADPYLLEHAIGRALERRRLLEGLHSLAQLGDAHAAFLRVIRTGLRDCGEELARLTAQLAETGILAQRPDCARLCSALQARLTSLADMTGTEVPNSAVSQPENPASGPP